MSEKNSYSFSTIIKGIFNILLMWIANVLIIIGMSYICTQFTLGPWYNAIIIATVVAILNTLLWPIFAKIFMPFLVYTFGIGALVLNDIIFYIASFYLPGIEIGIAAILQVPLAMAFASTLVSNIAHIDLYGSYMESISNQAKKRKKKNKKQYPGMIILEIDGLAKDILMEAIENDSMPKLKSWLESGEYSVKEWETDLSSQTGASQAGILHGNNEELVAYRWVSKENGNKIIVSSNLKQTPLIEQEISNGNGLLSDNGASRSNMFSGDTDNVIFTSSKLRDVKKMNNPSWYAVFSNSYNFQRICILFVWELLIEFKSQIIHEIKNIKPRLRRGLVYASTRAGANVFLREITTETLIGDILIGDIDVAYASYMGYDEVAHHSGIRDEDVWNVLKMIDLQFNRLEKAVEIGDRMYEFVILSDHGQGNGATFKQKNGISFPKFVRSLLPENMEIYSEMNSNLDHFNDLLYQPPEHVENLKEKMDNLKINPLEESESLQNLKEKYGEGIDYIKNIEIINQNEQLRTLKRKYDDILEYITTHKAEKHEIKKPQDSELIVLGSGNLALIYFSQWKHRLSYEEIVMNFPDLIPGLVKNQDIGFIVVDSKRDGPLVIGDKGIYYLNTDKIKGENPLKDYGKRAAEHIKRHNKFKDMPDILVNSYYDPENEEICAFEELIGSHGGLGGTQTQPFIMYPSYWDVPDELVGAQSIYNLLKNELTKLKEE